MNFPLNPAQRDAVRTTDTPLLVLAGAGSGKTRVITAKIAHLCESGLAPGKIVAITFTNKAAREMRERTQALQRHLAKPQAGGGVTIATFHALGLSIVRREARAMGLKPAFSIFDPSDLESIVGELIVTADRARARAAQWQISQWKNALTTPAEALEHANDDDQRTAAHAYARYADTLAAYQAVDFDDLIVRPLELFGRDADAAARWSTKYAHVLVDEYQDTNPAQYALFRHLAGEQAMFTAVGDDDQAIYGWRGATIENLARLTVDYPALRVIKLEQNYRSSVRILRSANALIANNSKLHAKKLWSELGTGETIRVASCADDDAEAEIVVAAISAQRFEQRGKYGDFAVLYRGNHQARAMETALRAANIPYVLSGGQSYFERAEIKDIVAYLRLVANDDDNPAFVRAVTTPRRGVGESTLAKLGSVAGAAKMSLFAAVFDPAFNVVAQPRAREVLQQFCALINDLRDRAASEPAARLLTELVSAIGYDDYLTSKFAKRDAQNRGKSVQDFVDWLSKKGETDGKSLTELTQMIALITLLEGRDGETADAVHLSTLHAAKGLEFPHVFLIGLEEGILPHRQAIDAGNVEEERRLMYVGVTRAQHSLHLSFCRSRKRAGSRVDARPSRFLGELAQEDLRYSGAPLPAGEAAREKESGMARLRAMRALLP